ncbi:MAG: tyrosine-type recombinase/integrase [Deltaproteobacteria bacterium]|nr:tyrosine-type recombinase/integrase [Deltaproteobacteria bacterium]
MDLSVAIADFKNHLKAAGYAETTMVSYQRNLNQFEQYLQGRSLADLRKVTHQVIVDYQQQVMSESIALESKALKIRPVKRLFEYLTDTHRLLINPTEGIVETTRKNRKIGPVLTVDEIRKLFEQPNLSLRTGIRDRAIMETMYSSGIRLGALLNVQVYHMDLTHKRTYIRKGKGGKQRVVPLGKSAVSFLREYLDNIRPYYAKKNPRERKLVLNHFGLPMTPASVREILQKYKTAAGIKKSASPHTLRRTCATHLLQQGADIRYIQKLLGHRRLSTTQAYTKVMPVDVKKTHNKTHPGVRGQKTEVRSQKTDDRSQKTDGSLRRAQSSRRQKSENRKQKKGGQNEN